MSLKTIRKVLAAVIVLSSLAYIAYTAVGVLYPLKYIDIIKKYSAEYGLDEKLVCAIIHSESRFNDGAVSSKGARGLMQLIETTADWAAAEMDIEGYSYSRIHEPDINIRMGCWYISKLIKQYGNTETALAAYNAGSGNVSKWLTNPEYSDDGVTLKKIPFPETEKYVDKIKKSSKIYGVLLKFTN